MLRVTVASLLARRLRLILTATTIVIGVAFVAGTFILTDSLQGALGPPAAVAAEVIVQPAGAGGGKSTGPARSATLAASLVARIRAVPGVSAAEGLVTAAKVMLIGKDGRPIRHRRAVSELRSFPASQALAAQYTLRSGRPPRRPGDAVLDAATARQLGYRVGDRIGLVTPHGVQTLTITGITGFGGTDSPAAEQVASFDTPTVVLVRAATAQRLAGQPGRFTEIDVRAAAGVPAAALRDRIARLLPPGLAAITGQQAAAQQDAATAIYVGRLRTDLLAFCAMALLVAAFVIANTFSILAAQLSREHALLRVLGASRGQLLRSVLAEAAAVGLAASAAGVGFGILAAIGLRGIISLLGGTLPAGGLAVAPRTAAVALAAGVSVTVASALRPARLAARVAPVRALREPQPGAPRRSLGRLAAALAALCLAAVLVAAGLLSLTSQSTVLVGAGALAGIAALVIAGPLIAGPLAHVLTAPMARDRPMLGRRGVTARLARDNTTANLRRTAATAATLIIGLAVAATALVIAASARASVRDAIGSGSRADLYLDGDITPGLTRSVAARPGVLAVMRVSDPLVAVAGTRARVAGLDPASAPALMNLGVRGGTITALHGDGLVVSASEAARHGWTTGSHVAVNFGQGPPRSLTVAGIFADKRFLGDDYLISITTLFRYMPDQRNVGILLLVRAVPGTGPLTLRAAIAPLLRASPAVTMQTAAQYEQARAADLGDLGHILGLLTALVALTDLIAALGIANALALSLTERTHELGVMRALGLTRHQLAAMIRIESVITCLLGALPGAALGVGAGAALAATLTRGQTGVATISVPLGPLAIVLTLTCLAGLLAAALPARHAARLPIPRAISEQAA
jgi:putative ABC transport system permease protein